MPGSRNMLPRIILGGSYRLATLWGADNGIWLGLEVDISTRNSHLTNAALVLAWPFL